MTKNQIEFMLSLLDAESASSSYNPLINNRKIIFSKDQRLYTDIAKYRYKFDLSNGLLERITVRLYSKSAQDVPAHDDYDSYTINGELCVFEYIKGADGKIIKDIFDINNIIIFVPNNEYLNSDIVNAVSNNESAFTNGKATNVQSMFNDLGYSDVFTDFIFLPYISRIDLSNNEALWRRSKCKYKIDKKRELLYQMLLNEYGNEIGISAVVDCDLIIAVETYNQLSNSQFSGNY